MLLLLSALLAGADPVAEFSFAAGAGTRGERRAEAVARASSGEFALTLGAADFAGPDAPLRQEILFGAQLSALRAEFRAVPPSEGMQRLSAELGVHFEPVGLVLGARTATLGSAQLQGAFARLELEGQIAEDVRAGLALSGWALQLDARTPRSAWMAWGNGTLDWAQRLEAGLWLSREFGELFSLTPALSVAQSAQAGVYEARASLSLEVPLGPLKLRAEPAVARQWPEMWMFDLTAGIALTMR